MGREEAVMAGSLSLEQPAVSWTQLPPISCSKINMLAQLSSLKSFRFDRPLR
jgi:hypothetical protein